MLGRDMEENQSSVSVPERQVAGWPEQREWREMKHNAPNKTLSSGGSSHNRDRNRVSVSNASGNGNGYRHGRSLDDEESDSDDDDDDESAHENAFLILVS